MISDANSAAGQLGSDAEARRRLRKERCVVRPRVGWRGGVIREKKPAGFE